MPLLATDPDTLRVSITSLGQVIGAIVAAMATLGAVVIPLRMRSNRHRRRFRDVLAEVRDNVSNEHATNLRDDIDGVRDSVNEVLRAVNRTNANVQDMATTQAHILRTTAAVDRRVGRVDKRVGGIDRRLKVLEPRPDPTATTDPSSDD